MLCTRMLRPITHTQTERSRLADATTAPCQTQIVRHHALPTLHPRPATVILHQPKPQPRAAASAWRHAARKPTHLRLPATMSTTLIHTHTNFIDTEKRGGLLHRTGCRVPWNGWQRRCSSTPCGTAWGACTLHKREQSNDKVSHSTTGSSTQPGAYTRPLFGST
jgi:hypothetical protein